ncbi:MAG: lytic transglycosylase domain-containing protein [Treponema sp.]|jgi:soluble lytic murein transglycosylase|nr:lytic transglycosylase domain-containing protein [Treponema sp.]
MFPGYFFFFLLMLGTLVSCKGESVLGISKEEAAQRLKAGDISFILAADPVNLAELRLLHPSTLFYGGLLVQAAAQRVSNGEPELDQEHSQSAFFYHALFEAALGSPSPQIRAAAAQELMVPLLEETQGKSLARRLVTHIPEQVPAETSPLSKNFGARGTEFSLYGAALYMLGRFDEGLRLLERQGINSSWDEALVLLSRWGLQDTQVKGDIRDWFLTSTPDRAFAWAFEEMQNQDAEFFTPGEAAAIKGRLAVSHFSYGEGLQYFRQVLPEEPALFFHYPELTNDLGRSFQYAGSLALAQGIALFLEWDSLLAANMQVSEETTEPDDLALQKAFIEKIEKIEKKEHLDVPNIRYRLQYFAGRMERQRGRPSQAMDHFKTALIFAPDALQQDACIWYILHIGMMNNPEQVLSLMDTYLPQWHEDSYFADILDLLCRYLTANRQWEGMLHLFSQIRFRSDGASTAKYAYILGRAISEAYLSPEQGAAALGVFNMTSPTTELKSLVTRTFFKIALEEEASSFYYRAMSAFQLGEHIIPIPMETPQAEKPALSPGDSSSGGNLAFLQGFFEFSAGRFAFSYLQTMLADLSIPELRLLAQTFAAAAYWEESIRIITAYMSRESYTLTYEDMLLYYPRSFMEIIEANAQDAGIPPELLYGLIRTESAFNPAIVSHAGAVGLSQLMSDTALEVAKRISKEGGPDYLEDQTLDLQNPAMNVHIGTSYLRYLMDRLESPLQALLAYNGGMTRVKRWRTAESLFPEDLFLETISITETRNYGKRVLAAAAAYGYLYFDIPMETVVINLYKGFR